MAGAEEGAERHRDNPHIASNSDLVLTKKEVENVAKINTPLDKLLVVEDTGLSKVAPTDEVQADVNKFVDNPCCLIRLTRKTLGKREREDQKDYRRRTE